MKTIQLLLLLVTQAAFAASVGVNSTGLLTTPTNFFAKNTGAIVAAVSPHISGSDATKVPTNNGTAFNLTNRSTLTSQAITGQTNDSFILRHTNGNPAMIVNSNASVVNWFYPDGTHASGVTNLAGVRYDSVSNRLVQTVNGANGAVTFGGVSVINGGTINGTDVSGSASLAVTSVGFISSGGASGKLVFKNWAGDNFTALQFGGTTSDHAALWRSGSGLNIINAAGSAFSILKAGSFAVSNINGTASTALATNLLLLTNVGSYQFSSATGTNFTLTLPTNLVVFDGALFHIALDAAGTNYLNLTPTSAPSLSTADKINRSTNWIITPGMTVQLQKQGTNWNIIAGAPAEPIGSVSSSFTHLAGLSTNLASWYVWCDGQTLADAGSPLNGVVIPDLNNTPRFLRGGITTGATGGSDTHTHTTGAGDNDNKIAAVTVGGDTDVSTIPHFHTTDAGSSVPAYNTVRWKMRVK